MKINPFQFLLHRLALLSAVWAASVPATVLTFDRINYAVGCSIMVWPDNYGDRVTTFSYTPPNYEIYPDSTWFYDPEFGTTPHIVTDCLIGAGDSIGIPDATACFFGDLFEVVKGSGGTAGEQFIQITLTADLGHVVHLHSFDIANIVGPRPLKRLRILNGTTTMLDQHGVSISGGPGGTHTTFNNATNGWMGGSLTVRLDAPYDESLLGEAQNHHISRFGIDNIAFSEAVAASDIDADGVMDAVEDGLPNPSGMNGDGNRDGIPDRLQAHIASFRGARFGTYMTLSAYAPRTPGDLPVRLVDVRTVDPASASMPPPPSDVAFLDGVVSFRVEGLPEVGATVWVKLFLHETPFSIGLMKYSTSRMEWLTLGQEELTRIDGRAGEIGMRLTDGGPYDEDGVANGVIVDPLAPVVFTRSFSLIPWSATQAQVSWATEDLGLVLQYSTNLAPPVTWLNDTNSVVTNGALKNVTVSFEPGQRFYRLGPP